MPAKTTSQKPQPKQVAQPVKAQPKKSVSKSKSPARARPSTPYRKHMIEEESKVAPAKRKCKFESNQSRQRVNSESADSQGAP